MPALRSNLWASALLCVIAACLSAPFSGQTLVGQALTSDASAALFDNAALQTLEITMHARDWEDLRVDPTSNDDYPCDLTWNGVRARNVGVRSRGLGSRFGPKPGLELTFDRYATRQRFLGLRSIVLDNAVTDPSMLRETVALAFLARVGVPAPRATHARVFVNGQYAGLYGLVEPIDSVFSERRFGTEGTLFEYRWTFPFFATFPGEDLDAYRTLFAPRVTALRSTFDLYSPVRDLFQTINQAPDASFANDVDALLDLNTLIRMVAADVVLAEWDGVLGYDGMNNVYLRRDGSRSQLIPWDKDHTFRAADYPLLAGANENVLMRRLLNDADLRATFFTAVSDAAESAAAGNWLVGEVNRQYAQIRPAALADGVKPFSNDEFDEAVAEVLASAITRPAWVLGEAQRLR